MARSSGSGREAGGTRAAARVLACAAAALVAGACGGGDDGAALAGRLLGPEAGWDEASDRDLYALLAELADSDVRRPASRVLDLDFDRAEDVRHFEFRGLVGLPRVEDGLLRMNTREGGQFRIAVDLAAEDLTHLLIEFGERPAHSAVAEIFWRVAGDPDFTYERSMRVALGGARDGALLVPLAASPQWTGRVVALRIAPVNEPATVEIDRLRGLHAEDAFRLPSWPAGELFVLEQQVGRELRRAALLPPGVRLVERLRVEPGQRLTFGAGYAVDTRIPCEVPSPTELVVTAAGAGGEERELAAVRFAEEEGDGWSDVALDLSPFAGRELTLTFAARPVAGSARETHVGFQLLSEPRVGRAAPQTDALNVLLISVDTLRADHLEPYGHDAGTSPNVQALADSGVTFTGCVSTAPTTLLSHGAIFTGISSLETHQRGSELPEERTTLAEILRAHGYATAAFAGGAFFDPFFGLAQGFDVYSFAKDTDALASYSYTDVETNTRRALRWIERNDDRPFFLFFHTYEVHSPYTPRDPKRQRPAGPSPGAGTWYAIRSNNKDVPLKPGVTSAWNEYVYDQDPETFAFRPAFEGEVRMDLVVDTYDSEIRLTDGFLGRLFASLRERGIAGNTLVILTSDHGEAFGEQGRVGHGHLYETNLRVPLVMRLPGRLPAGRRVDGRVHTTDLVPTVLDVLGLPVPEGLPGVSLLPIAAGEEGAALPARTFVSHEPDAGVALRTPDERKLICTVKASHVLAGRKELFDLRADPREEHDLYPTLDPARRAELEAQVLAALARMPGLHLDLTAGAPFALSARLTKRDGGPPLAAELSCFPLEPGRVSWPEGDATAAIETAPLERWLGIVDRGPGELELEATATFADGTEVELAARFPVREAAERGFVKTYGDEPHRVRLEVRGVGPKLRGREGEEAAPQETLDQLDALGYAE